MAIKSSHRFGLCRRLTTRRVAGWASPCGVAWLGDDHGERGIFDSRPKEAWPVLGVAKPFASTLSCVGRGSPVDPAEDTGMLRGSAQLHAPALPQGFSASSWSASRGSSGGRPRRRRVEFQVMEPTVSPAVLAICRLLRALGSQV
jgi:hypothetical protein